MSILDKDGKEMSTKAKDLEYFDKEYQELIEKVIEKPSNKLQLLGSQNPQDYQQIISFAVQEINRIILYRLVKQAGKESLKDIITDQDANHLGTELSNAISSGKEETEGNKNSNINEDNIN